MTSYAMYMPELETFLPLVFSNIPEMVSFAEEHVAQELVVYDRATDALVGTWCPIYGWKKETIQ